MTLRCTKLISSYQIKNTMCLEDLKNMMINNFKFNIKHNWFVHSSLSWLRTIVCYLDLVSPLEYILKVYSEYVSDFIT